MSTILPGDVVERDYTDHAGGPTRTQRFTVAAVHHLASDHPRNDGWWVSALTPETAARTWPGGEAVLLRGGHTNSLWGVMPHPGIWLHADEVRVVSPAPIELDLFGQEATA